jgi:hypothetical protein
MHAPADRPPEPSADLAEKSRAPTAFVKFLIIAEDSYRGCVIFAQ